MIEFHPDDDANQSKAMKVHARIFGGITATTGVRRVPLQQYAHRLNTKGARNKKKGGVSLLKIEERT